MGLKQSENVKGAVLAHEWFQFSISAPVPNPAFVLSLCESPVQYVCFYRLVGNCFGQAGVCWYSGIVLPVRCPVSVQRDGFRVSSCARNKRVHVMMNPPSL